MRASDRAVLAPVLGAALAAALAACVPAARTAPQSLSSIAVSDAGAVAWVWHGHAWAATPPTYAPVALATATAASSVAWRDEQAWLALPAASLVVRASGVPDSVTVPGRPALLSPTLVALGDGHLYTYDAQPAGILPAAPTSVLERDGRAWAIAGGAVFEIAGGAARAVQRVPEDLDAPTLLPALTAGYELAAGPAVRDGNALIAVRDGRLVSLDARGAVVASRELGAGAWRLASGGGVVAALGERRVVAARTTDLAVILDVNLEGATP